MRKMKLDIDTLVVDSFAAGDEGAESRWTVHGNAAFGLITERVTCYTACGGSTCYETGSPCVGC